MFSPYCNGNAASPNAQFLSYFHQPHGVHSYNKSAQMTRSASPHLRDTSETKYRLFDEEAQSAFSDLNSTTDTDCESLSQLACHYYNSVFHTLYNFWGFVCVVTLTAYIVLLGLNLALGQFGIGPALTDRIMGRHSSPPPPIVRDLHFCLASPNREAPGPQIWRLMSMGPYKDCTTEMLTLLVSPSEGWRLHSDDEIIVGDKRRPSLDSIRAGKFLDNGNVLARGELGDDIAEEGVLSHSGGEAPQGDAVIV